MFRVAVLVCAAALPAPAEQSSPAERLSAVEQSSSVGRHRRHADRAPGSQSPVTAATPPVAAPAEPVIPSPPAPRVIVAYQQASLAVTAENAPLSEILDQVRESTGVAIEAPLLDERLSVRLGPDAPAQVIASLFEGLPIDYAILGGTSERHPLERIIVTLHPGAGPPPDPAFLEAAAARERTRVLTHLAETGGDEGVSDNPFDRSPEAASSPPPPRKSRPE